MEIATADAQCQQASDLRARLQSVIDRDAQEWLRRNRDAVQRAAADLQDAISRADRLVRRS
ncbi:hypothetical protein [Solwaraspora sp. WMMA2065]|uniref:hypothetical protein n=1 Tax=Solwaraspora sp. WMMA2065 TaxID=3015166 RepID=UPI00259B191B|nr:hypothetical protein [Solwaraspora sp. WMMA2065]WJK33067.1 hypothetical protein O7610_20395 [Solwaraspora sp. WMMA2065]